MGVGKQNNEMSCFPMGNKDSPDITAMYGTNGYTKEDCTDVRD